MAIGAVIGIISSVISLARAFSSDEPKAAAPEQKADKLFAKLDEMGRGEIGAGELQAAFGKIGSAATAGADRLFARLDADGDGKLTRGEFSRSINRLAEQLDEHYLRLRLQGDGRLPALASSDTGFTREELSGQLTNIISNFGKVDADGDGRASLREIQAYARQGRLEQASPANANVELMLQVVRLMQAYGVVGGAPVTAEAAPGQIADHA